MLYLNIFRCFTSKFMLLNICECPCNFLVSKKLSLKKNKFMGNAFFGKCEIKISFDHFGLDI